MKDIFFFFSIPAIQANERYIYRKDDDDDNKPFSLKFNSIRFNAGKVE